MFFFRSEDKGIHSLILLQQDKTRCLSHERTEKLARLVFTSIRLFVCGGSLTSGQLVKGSFQTALVYRKGSATLLLCHLARGNIYQSTKSQLSVHAKHLFCSRGFASPRNAQKPTFYIYCNRTWGGGPVTALSKGAVVIYLVAWYHCRYGSVSISCCLWAAGDQQGGRQGSRLPQGTICYRERHYELLPVGCWRPAGG